MEKQRFDIVLMDIQMPVMDGEKATRYIRRSTHPNMGKHVPIIAMTAHALKGDKERFLEKGMDAYISKPLEVDELKLTIEKFAHPAQAAEPAQQTQANG